MRVFSNISTTAVVRFRKSSGFPNLDLACADPSPLGDDAGGLQRISIAVPTANFTRINVKSPRQYLVPSQPGAHHLTETSGPTPFEYSSTSTT